MYTHIAIDVYRYRYIFNFFFLFYIDERETQKCLATFLCSSLNWSQGFKILRFISFLTISELVVLAVLNTAWIAVFHFFSRQINPSVSIISLTNDQLIMILERPKIISGLARILSYGISVSFPLSWFFHMVFDNNFLSLREQRLSQFRKFQERKNWASNLKEFKDSIAGTARRAWSQTDLGKLGEIVFCAILDSNKHLVKGTSYNSY